MNSVIYELDLVHIKMYNICRYADYDKRWYYSYYIIKGYS